MLLIHQDRDIYLDYDKNSVLTVAPVVHDDLYFGHNVYCDNIMLGTFDDYKDALREVDMIQYCNNQVYCISLV